ncbi:MAG TPA: MdtA/MuxA family multidrug efflux RND transporter periplasmic adaptor subunit, partial [Gammaproteobacteria bacterium]|nr:MdtA/MuxA family multidrug efflux RND transporter periplasmic adaptor subunit [Gammaproteobacteria bacterium]
FAVSPTGVPVDLRPRSRQPRPRSRPHAWVAVLALVLAGGLLLDGCSGKGQQAAGGRRFGQGMSSGPLPVRAASATNGDIRIDLSALGTVTPLATVTVRTQINGQLMQIAFREGQMVKKGEFLALVDPRPYENALEQAQGQLAKDQALYNQAQADLQRYKALAAQDSISAQQLQDQEFVADQYRGAMQMDQAQVDTAKLNISYCHISAPVSGRVGLRQVDVGNYVQPSDSNGIVVITELDPISVVFNLPEDNIPRILQRMGQGAKLPVALYDRTNTTKLAEGTLAAVDNQINTSTGTANLRALFDNPGAKLLPNQFVNAELLVDTLHNVTVIPNEAIQRGVPGTFVYRVNPDDSVSVQVITLGPQDGDLVQVLSGLKSGDKVVTDGADQLKDGAKVSIANAAGTTAAPAAATQNSKAKWSGRHRRSSAGGNS